VARLRAIHGPAPRALEFIVLTSVRASEACGALWAEIEGDVWTIPAARMKAGKQHRVPLSQAALDLIGRMPQTGTHVFLGRAGPR
jgi:integrase